MKEEPGLTNIMLKLVRMLETCATFILCDEKYITVNCTFKSKEEISIEFNPVLYIARPRNFRPTYSTADYSIIQSFHHCPNECKKIFFETFFAYLSNDPVPVAKTLMEKGYACYIPSGLSAQVSLSDDDIPF